MDYVSKTVTCRIPLSDAEMFERLYPKRYGDFIRKCVKLALTDKVFALKMVTNYSDDEIKSIVSQNYVIV